MPFPQQLAQNFQQQPPQQRLTAANAHHGFLSSDDLSYDGQSLSHESLLGRDSIEGSVSDEWVIFSPTTNAIPDKAHTGTVSTIGDQPCDSSLALPGHNGAGQFASHNASFERVNQWLDQSRLFLDLRLALKSPPPVSHQPATQQSMAQLLDDSLFDDNAYMLPKPKTEPRNLWTSMCSAFSSILMYPEDATMDALLTGRPLPEEQEAEHQHSKALSHFERARQLGPPDWDNKLLRFVLAQIGVQPVSSSPGVLALLLNKDEPKVLAVSPWPHS